MQDSRDRWILWEGTGSCVLRDRCARAHVTVSRGPAGVHVLASVLTILVTFTLCYVFLSKVIDLFINES